MTGDGKAETLVVGEAGGDSRGTVATLEAAGFAATAVDGIGPCLDRLARDGAGAVVTAGDLPDGDALDLLETIEDRHVDLPVFVAPEDGSERLAGEAFASGASGYVPGDAAPGTLVDRLDEGIAGDRILGEETGRYRNLIETSPAPINLFDADGRTVWGNDAVVELLGLEDRSGLVGRSIFDFIHPEDRPVASDELERIVEEEVSTGPTYMRLVRADDEVRHVRVATAPGRYRGERIGQAIVVDVTPLRTHERRLERLNEMLGECIEAETKASVCDTFVRAAEGELGLPVVSLALLDEDGGELRAVARTAAADRTLDETALLSQEGGAAWEAFVAGEPRVLEGTTTDTATGLDERYVVPLGRHGVLVAGIDPADEDFVEILAESVQGMFDRIERESLLQERKRLLAEQNEMLGRVNRINRVIRSIDGELVGASTRAEVDAAVCRELVEPELFSLAWIGDYEPSTGRVVPREHAGDEQGYLDAVEVTADEGETGQGPTGRAVRTRTPQVTDDVLTDPPFEPWREAALSRGYRSSIALPLVHRGALYGVLNIYANEPGVFDAMERQVLEELGDVIAHAINAIESRQALVSDAVVELELGLTLDGQRHAFVEFVREATDRRFELQAVVPSETGGLRAIMAIDGATPDEIASLARRSRTIESATVLADREGTCTVECVVSEGSLVFWLVDRGAIPRSFTVSESETRLVVDLSADADVREFVEQLRGLTPSVELLSRTERERPVRTRHGFLATFERRLTPRQREVLETAYASGYFETPRTRTGAEIAESLDISQPTFSDHLRSGLRTLLGLLYEDDDPDA